MNPHVTRRLVHMIDPLVDPSILYFFVAGFLKPVVYAAAALTDPAVLYRPDVGLIWHGIDANVVASSASYMLCAGLLLMMRDHARGLKLGIICSRKNARRLSAFLVFLSVSSILETYFVGSGYLSVIILPVYLGWLSLGAVMLNNIPLLFIVATSYLATLSKWTFVALPFIFSINGAILASVALLGVYPLLNQVRYFVIGIALGYSASESFQLLHFGEFSIIRLFVSFVYRIQSFESSYLINELRISSSSHLSVFDLSKIVSYDILDLDYGIAISLFSQLSYLCDSPIVASFGICAITLVYMLVAKKFIRYYPSAMLILGLYLPLILSDGFVPHRSLYFFAGLVVFLCFTWLSRLRVRLGDGERSLPNAQPAFRNDIR